MTTTTGFTSLPRALLLALTATLTMLCLPASHAAKQDAYAIVGATLITADGGTVPDQTVLVADGRITAIGKNLAVPGNSQAIDATGRFLMPGLYELHAHVPTDKADIERVMSLFLANGVTTVRGMLGAPAHLTLRSRIADGKMIAPRLITSGPSLNGRSVANGAAGERLVKEQHAAGYDFIKLHPGLTRDSFTYIAKTASVLGIPIAGHVSQDVGLDAALSAGQASIDHLDGYIQALVRDDVKLADHSQQFFAVQLAPFVDDKKIAQYAARTKKAGVWNVPTQTLMENVAGPTSAAELAARDEMRYMPKATVNRWRDAKENFVDDASFDPAVAARFIGVRQALIKALVDNGAGILLGSDAPQIFNVPGFATHRELQSYVTAGLTPTQALATGTVNPAVFFHESEDRGRITVGAHADLLLLDANPLSDIRNTRRIAGVMRAGHWLNRKALDEILARYRED